jgi:hypothetical protein
VGAPHDALGPGEPGPVQASPARVAGRVRRGRSRHSRRSSAGDLRDARARRYSRVGAPFAGHDIAEPSINFSELHEHGVVQSSRSGTACSGFARSALGMVTRAVALPLAVAAPVARVRLVPGRRTMAPTAPGGGLRADGQGRALAVPRGGPVVRLHRPERRERDPVCGSSGNGRAGRGGDRACGRWGLYINCRSPRTGWPSSSPSPTQTSPNEARGGRGGGTGPKIPPGAVLRDGRQPECRRGQPALGAGRAVHRSSAGQCGSTGPRTRTVTRGGPHRPPGAPSRGWRSRGGVTAARSARLVDLRRAGGSTGCTGKPSSSTGKGRPRSGTVTPA